MALSSDLDFIVIRNYSYSLQRNRSHSNILDLNLSIDPTAKDHLLFLAKFNIFKTIKYDVWEEVCWPHYSRGEYFQRNSRNKKRFVNFNDRWKKIKNKLRILRWNIDPCHMGEWFSRLLSTFISEVLIVINISYLILCPEFSL